MHDALRQACLTIRPTPPSAANVGSKADGAPFLLRRLNDTTERPEYAAQLYDGSSAIVASKENATAFSTEREARMWRASRLAFWQFKIVSARSLPPEDEDEPDSEGERERTAGVAGTGDIGRGPELIGSDLPRFASRVRDEREMD